MIQLLHHSIFKLTLQHKIIEMKLLTTLLLILITSPLFAESDYLLGKNFDLRRFEMGTDYSGNVRSTLITRTPLLTSDRAILYIHGYNDYFFQEEMADRFYNSAYNFYAIDLRKYGRSHTPQQTLFEVRNLHEYFADIDAALQVIRAEGAKEVVLMGHSTGGLIATYYCGTQQNTPPIEGLILNSPFLDMNLSPLLESVGVPIVSAIGALLPELKIMQDGSTAYFDSLHASRHGEWSYDPSLKLALSPAVTAGWIRAIHTAQSEIQEGYNLQIPILLLYSDKSIVASEWSEEYQKSDSVLDVEDIAKYGVKLGSNVTKAEIKDGMHDIILSGKTAREEAYHTIFEWLEEEF